MHVQLRAQGLRLSGAYQVPAQGPASAKPTRPAVVTGAGARQPPLPAVKRWSPIPAVKFWSPQVSGQEETVQAELEDSRSAVLAARQTGDEQVEQDLMEEWQSRLRRLVAADPQLVDELRHVVAQLSSALADIDPPQAATITMQATTFGKSRVNQAGRDLHITTGE